jgi:hypothetical protein
MEWQKGEGKRGKGGLGKIRFCCNRTVLHTKGPHNCLASQTRPPVIHARSVQYLIIKLFRISGRQSWTEECGPEK